MDEYPTTKNAYINYNNLENLSNIYYMFLV